MIFNVTGGGVSGATLTVTGPAGVTVTVSKGGKTRTRQTGSDGIAVFKGLESGTWTVTITDGSQTASKQVLLTTDYTAQMSFNAIPEFTYTGDYQIVSDADSPITTSQGNWKIRFLTSGVLKFTSLNGAESGIDIFLVGGGGGGGIVTNGAVKGGGGGYTDTKKNISASVNTSYNITVGAGGSENSKGGNSSFADIVVSGGDPGGSDTSSGNGGSGGGGAGAGGYGGTGGSDGSDGEKSGGKGQGTTTREFGESTGTLYAGGGGGGAYYHDFGGNPGGTGGSGGGGQGGGYCNTGRRFAGSPGSVNTGGGGGGGSTAGGAGGSGIVIIRNAR